MPRKKKVVLEEEEVPAAAGSLEALEAENRKLREEVSHLKPRKLVSPDGAVTFKSPWLELQIPLRRGTYRSLSPAHTVIDPPVMAKFDNQVCTFLPADTFVNVNGSTVRKIDRMREIYKEFIAKRKRPPFIEVTESNDLKIVSRRERMPPSAMVEFYGLPVEFPAMPPPPPKEAKETIETLEKRRPMYGGGGRPRVA